MASSFRHAKLLRSESAQHRAKGLSGEELHPDATFARKDRLERWKLQQLKSELRGIYENCDTASALQDSVFVKTAIESSRLHSRTGTDKTALAETQW